MWSLRQTHRWYLDSLIEIEEIADTRHLLLHILENAVILEAESRLPFPSAGSRVPLVP
jgi:hypothetical protein